MKKPSTSEAFKAAMESTKKSRLKPDDPGYTIPEMAAMLGFSLGYTRKAVNDMIQAGKLRRSGTRYSVSHQCAVYELT